MKIPLQRKEATPPFEKEVFNESLCQLSLGVSPGVTMKVMVDSEYQEVEFSIGAREVLILAGLPKIENMIEVLKEVRHLLEE